MIVTFLGVLVAGYPIWRQHQKKVSQEGLQGARAKATQDAVLGTPADPNTGKPAVRGLVVDVSELVNAVGRMNGTGKNLVQMAEESLRISSKTASLLDEHTKQDDKRFAEIAKYTGENNRG